MDDANTKLENGLEPIYDHVRRPFKRLYLNRAVTQNYLQGLTNPTIYFDMIFSVS